MKEVLQDSFKKFQRYFNKPILKIEGLNHKGNNKLFKVTLKNEENLLKEYSGFCNDGWKRGKTEYTSLVYLWNKGFREIPQPIKFYEKENIGIYSFNDGRILRQENIKEGHINTAVNFLVRIHNLSNEDKEFFNSACSACLCLKDYLDVIDKRLNKIVNYNSKEKDETSVRTFLDRVILKIEELRTDFLIKTKDIDIKKRISLDEQVLTPADFGFHNILINQKEEFTFIDFEYFGRDDPARQVLDFIHHDQTIGINRKIKELFLERYLDNQKRDIKERINLVDPLIGMTWVLIYLNVLSKDYLEHVKFAHGDIGNILNERLEKARLKLDNLNFFY